MKPNDNSTQLSLLVTGSPKTSSPDSGGRGIPSIPLGKKKQGKVERTRVWKAICGHHFAPITVHSFGSFHRSKNRSGPGTDSTENFHRLERLLRWRRSDAKGVLRIERETRDLTEGFVQWWELSVNAHINLLVWLRWKVGKGTKVAVVTYYHTCLPRSEKSSYVSGKLESIRLISMYTESKMYSPLHTNLIGMVPTISKV